MICERERQREEGREGGEEIKVLVLCVGSTQHGSAKVWGGRVSIGWHICAGGERRVYEFCGDVSCSKKPILSYQVFENFEKLQEIQAYNCTPDRFKGVLYPRRFPSLFSSIGFLGKTPGKNAFALPSEEQPCENCPVVHPDHSWDIFERKVWQHSELLFYFSSWEQINSLILKHGEEWELLCVCMRVPKSPLGTLGAAAGHVQLEDNALISSLRAGSGSRAVRPRLSVTSTLLAASLLSSYLVPASSTTYELGN